jgi:hypothetical protein
MALVSIITTRHGSFSKPQSHLPTDSKEGHILVIMSHSDAPFDVETKGAAASVTKSNEQSSEILEHPAIILTEEDVC